MHKARELYGAASAEINEVLAYDTINLGIRMLILVINKEFNSWLIMLICILKFFLRNIQVAP